MTSTASKPQNIWVVITPCGQVLPHSVAIHRARATKRFLTAPDFGFGRTWPYWKRKGYQLKRATISLLPCE